MAMMLGTALAGVDEEWAHITALDAGPKKKPASRDEAILAARTHLGIQRKAINDFLSKYPSDPRAFDARLRLASILAALGMMDNQPKNVEEAIAILTALEKTPEAPKDKRADAGFQRISLYFQSLRGREKEMRDSIVSNARNFTAKYPGDPRGPRLLVEAATICDSKPDLKRELLEKAQSETQDESLKHRIADDLGRLDFLGRPLNLKFETVQGGTFDTAAQKGNVTVLVFWSAESPHCLMWLRDFRKSMEAFPAKDVSVATISLDSNRKAFKERSEELQIADWPAQFDGKGWDNAVARPLGINAVPTVWILDRKGVLRTLNARDDCSGSIRRILAE